MHCQSQAMYKAALVVVCFVCSGHGRRVQINFEHRPPTEVEKSNTRRGHVGQQDGRKAKSPATAFKAVTEFLLAKRPGHAFIPHGAGASLGETVAFSRLQSSSKSRVSILMDGNNPTESDSESSEAKKLKLEAEIAALETKRMKLELEELKQKKLKLEAGLSAPSVESETPASLDADDVIIKVKKPEMQQSQPSSQSQLSSQSEESGESDAHKVGTTRAEFLEFIQDTAEQRGAKNPERLQQIVANALDAGRQLQRTEIEQLRSLLEKPPDKGLFPPKNELLSIADLVSKAQNPGLKAEESRGFARETFKFLAALNEEQEASDEKKIPVPGKGLVSSSALRERLKMLERHESASCTEYRLFAVALSKDDLLEEALGSCFVEDKMKAMIGSSAFMSRASPATQGAQGVSALTPMPGMTMQPGFSMSFGAPPMPGMPMQPGFDSGTPDLSALENRVLSSWLELLADLIARTTKSPSAGTLPTGMPPGMPPGMFVTGMNQMAPEAPNIFPFFLTFLARSQGNFEPLIVYYLARLVGSFNVQAVARSEARAVPLDPDAIVADQESKYLSKVQREALEDAGSALQASLGLGFFFSTAFSLFVLYSVFSTLSGLLSGIFAPPPVDPLNF